MMRGQCFVIEGKSFLQWVRHRENALISHRNWNFGVYNEKIL